MDEQELNYAIVKAGIPRHMHEPIRDYALHHQPVGGFLSAVLSNDFHGAACAADAINTVHLHTYGALLHGLPRACWGSAEAVDAWVNQGSSA